MADMNDPDLRKKLMLGVMLLGTGGYFGFQYLYSPRAEEVARLETRLEALQGRNGTARAAADGDATTALERSVELYREQLKRVEALIPSSEELPDLLDAIALEAQRTGVELALIQPISAIAEDHYTRRTYDLSVHGSYHQIADFLTRVASLPRIVTPGNLNMRVREEETRSGDPQLEAKFAIETYVFSSPEHATNALAAQ
jgi:type IV pilus assembly protein PilO